MLTRRPRMQIVLGIALITTLALLPALSAPAQAGCLREWESCGACAEKAFWRAVRRLDYGDASDAWLDALDCDIDLYHCIGLAIHHQYTCEV